MKRMLVLAALALPFGAFAQPVINKPLDFKPGDVLVYEKLNPTHPGPGGPSQTWDFSSVSPVVGDTNWYYCQTPPSNAPTPGANLVVIGSDGSYLYYNNQSGYGELLAIADSSNPMNLTVVYQDPVKIISRPLTYLDAFSDSCKESYQVEYLGSNYQLSGQGNHELTVDGYGTLILSDTTYQNVLRIRSQIVQSDVIQLMGIALDIERTSYIWMVDGLTAPVLRIDSTRVNSSLFSDDRYSMEKLLPQTPVSVASLTPETEMKGFFQGNDLILISDITSSMKVDIDLVNLQGQKVQSGSYRLQQGMNRISLNQDLIPGIYLLRWKDEHRSDQWIKLVR